MAESPGHKGVLQQRIDDLEDEVRRLRAALGRRAGRGPERLPGPVFVGGTGRSGTWVAGRMLGRSQQFVTIPTEVRFHATDGGLRRVLTGEEGVEQFAARVRQRWYGITGAGGNPKGLSLVASARDLNAADEQLFALAEEDLPLALRTYCHLLLDPFALGRGAVTWVETTPDNVLVVDCLHAVFPRSRVIHMVRDGRDVAASVVSMPWGPQHLLDGLAWWADRVRAADRVARASDPQRLRVIRMEELVLLDRDRQFDELVDFVGLQDAAHSARFFETKVAPTEGNVGRWRRDTSAQEAAEVDAAYRDLYARLAEEGVACLPITPAVADDISVSP